MSRFHLVALKKNNLYQFSFGGTSFAPKVAKSAQTDDILSVLNKFSFLAQFFSFFKRKKVLF